MPGDAVRRTGGVDDTHARGLSRRQLEIAGAHALEKAPILVFEPIALPVALAGARKTQLYR